MSYNVELLPDLPVLLVTIQEGFSLEAFNELMNQARQILDEQPSPIFHVTDFRESNIPLDEMLVGASEVSRGEASPFTHPNIRENIFITTSDYLKLVAEGMNSEPFGNLKISVFTSLDETLEYVRSQL
jgi:hypothetical protein